MALSLSEIRERMLQALKNQAESTVLTRWYNTVLHALEQEGVSTVQELDMRSRWIGGGPELVSEIQRYQKAAGIEVNPNNDELVVRFIKDTLGEQLTELGLEPRRIHVHNGTDDAHWVFMLKPGQEPNLNPAR